MKKFFIGIVVLVALGAAFISCSSVKSGIHADIIGFNDEVYTYYEFFDLAEDAERISKNKESKVAKLIYSIPNGKNTAEYYAMDIALDRIAEIAKDADENSRASYYLILLTDGLDNVSVEMAKRNGKGKYRNDDEYASYLQKRMETILDKKKSKPNSQNVFQAYPLMIYGSDLVESDLSEDDCKEILRKLAGAQNTFVPDPIVDESTDEILEQFKSTFVVSSFSFEVPKGYVGKTIRMEFSCKDKYNKYHKVYVNADFECQTKKKKETYLLKNITCSDMKLNFDQKNLLQIVADEDYDSSGNLVSFTFSNIKYDGQPSTAYSPSQSYNLNGYDPNGTGKYVKNSEYTEKHNRKTDSYILFVLDTSESLGSDGRKVANDTAIQIIRYVQDQLSQR
ncbi:MAG: hypothetical protein J6Y69_03435 [Treponema sp.]|nr:hypothetical protein [Treponema sp.]